VATKGINRVLLVPVQPMQLTLAEVNCSSTDDMISALQCLLQVRHHRVCQQAALA
jgi:hypothetical protein